MSSLWSEKLSWFAASAREAARGMDELSRVLRETRVEVVPVLVPVEDGGNRDTDTWAVPAEDTGSSPETGQRDKDSCLSLARTGAQFFDGTRWRTVRPRLYVAQGHP